MVAAQSGKMYVIHYFTEISANLRLMQFFSELWSAQLYVMKFMTHETEI